MPKVRTQYICQQCGHEAIRWLGRCPDCGGWNSFTEELVADQRAASRVTGPPLIPTGDAPKPIHAIGLDDHRRVASGIGEFDRVVGGGCVPGSVILIGGDPGIGKCVTGDTRVFDPESGVYRRITDWRAGNYPVLAVDERKLRLAPSPVAAFHERGVKPVVRVTTKLGRSLRCTSGHPVLTPDGWRPVGELAPGARIAGLPSPDHSPGGGIEAPVGRRLRPRRASAALRVPAESVVALPPAGYRLSETPQRSGSTAGTEPPPYGCLDPRVCVEPVAGGDGAGARRAVLPADRSQGEIDWDEIVSVVPDGEEPVYDLTVPGRANFVANDLVIHNSTLLMQVAARLSDEGSTTLYVTGEESVQQVRMRADRLGTLSEGLLVSAETNLDLIEAHIQRLRPQFVVLDSIQTAHDPSLASAAATVSQLRACCARMTRLAKGSETTVFLVGHVTKEGAIAGPRVLEHMVDTVLYFEGDRFQAHRILRGVKNRFGSTDEIGIFVMRENGLAEVANASEWMLAQRPAERPGSAVVAVVEGTRALLVEVQALVSRSFSPSPRRMATGLDYNRVCMILAVLEKRCGLRLSDKDVYVNVPGGVKVVEPAADLGVAVALASSYRDVPVDPHLVVAGEVGLSGEVRAVQQTEKRLNEGERLGFRRALAAGYRPRPGAGGIEVLSVSGVREALALAFMANEEEEGSSPGGPEPLPAGTADE